VHEVQDPALQTRFVPQLIPFATFVPASVHTGVPVEQVTIPSWHTFAGWHAVPEAQVMHAPLMSQTWFVPQVVPGGAIPVSTQTDAPVAQDVVPVWQGSAGVQAAPAVQATHAPVLHTWFVPQLTPFARLPSSVQTAVPVAHEKSAVRHGFADVHGPPQRWKLQTAEIVPRCCDEQSIA